MNIAGIIELVIMLPTGIAFLVLGMLLWKKQKISPSYRSRLLRNCMKPFASQI